MLLSRHYATWQLYIYAFEDMLAARRAAGKEKTLWKIGEDVFRWWTSDQQKGKPIDGQVDLNEMMGGIENE